MKTRETIEALESNENPIQGSAKTPKQRNPRSLANLIAPWTSETAPRNGGRPKKDVSQEIARQAFENNRERIYEAQVAQLLKGGAFAFQVLAERAYGKLKETRDTGSEFNEIPDRDLQGEIERIMQRVGLAREADDAAEAGVVTARAAKTNGKAQDPHLLPGNGAIKTRTV